MKKIIIVVAAAFCVSGASAQSIYDAAKFAGKDLNGTARFVGMGGAMGALGGDISTIGTNPAGIGIYRSNDFMTSFSFSTYGMDGKYQGYDKTYKNSLNNTNWSYDNIGFVFSTKIGNQTPLRYVNFGFNYHKSKSFYKNMAMDGLLNYGPDGKDYVSQTWQMAQQANGIRDSRIMDGKGAFDANDLGWLSILGWQGHLITESGDLDDQGGNIYRPIMGQGSLPYGTFRSEERGGIDQYDFNVALNFNDRVYLGLTIGAYDVDYRKYSSYDEDYGEGAGYRLQSWNQTKGSGFDFKFGAIIRPVETSPFRIGLAINSPTFYKLTLTTSALIQTDLFYNGEDKTTPVDVDTRNAVGDMNRDYRLRTPWSYNVSLGYTVGSSFAIGAEYEYEDYSTMTYRYPEGDEMEYETDQTFMMKGVNTFRIGAEYKVIPQFAFRLGYNYSSAVFKDDAYKHLAFNSIITDTDYANTLGMSNYTLGIGYRGEMFYADLAYKYSTYKENFYAFADPDDFLNKTKVTNSRSQVLMTVGIRF